MSFIKKYNCSQCNYGSDRKWTVKDHERRVHNNVNVTNQSNEFPTTVSVGYDTQKVATTMHAIEDDGRPPNTLTIPIGDYNKVVEYTHAWKDICEKLQQEKCADESRIKEKCRTNLRFTSF